MGASVGCAGDGARRRRDKLPPLVRLRHCASVSQLAEDGMEPRIESGVARGKISAGRKRAIAQSMYAKGKAFIGAALLLRQKGGYEYVVLHLICQGVENVLKGLLLNHNYDKYEPKLRQYFRHDLTNVTHAAIKASGDRIKLKDSIRTELELLNTFYSKQWLRYGCRSDIFIDPRTISSHLVLRRMAALLRIIEHKRLMHEFAPWW
jgi:hypothetical protein